MNRNNNVNYGLDARRGPRPVQLRMSAYCILGLSGIALLAGAFIYDWQTDPKHQSAPQSVSASEQPANLATPDQVVERRYGVPRYR